MEQALAAAMGDDGQRGGNDPRRADCRVLSTRQCPTSGCDDLPCARFDDDDERRWGPEVQYIDDLGRAA